MYQGGEAFKVLDRVVVEAGSNFFREGDGGMRAYVVQSGSVEIWRNIDGERVVYATIGEGGIFGEMALVDRSTRTANATAVEGTVCIVINEMTFRRKLRETDSFLAGLIRVMVANIRSLHQEQSGATALEALEDEIDIIEIT
ncbi:MAG: cyclic nucleotide-binding domain-containing protein [Rhodospirillaceae bacterium]|jgi:CRP/FNR family transcriptional regulator, cyclic AMP receptor protein|nr:cyclic nucleotide-binding domain-containing protein [Rhodospirillaceae bacterium]MBT5667862.1 cyclic nucleotide-binding domain-containing protein [Rhodospirillaceae bacterium]MBT5812185.1 cyclic nucleotide-binding domain-containing protein [Rhodospirillaceae bacterium]